MGPRGPQGPAGEPAEFGPFAEQVGPVEARSTAWLDVPGVSTEYPRAGISEVRVALTARVRAARAGGGLEHCLLSMGPATAFNDELIVEAPADGSLSGHVTVSRVWRSYTFPGAGTQTLKLKVRRADDQVAGACVVEATVLEVATR
jgi:hypothetical protein